MSDDQRLDQILDAAYVCFTRHGVRRTTMDDIAREAGLSRPSVYQQVRNKEDAFRRLVARLLDASLARSRAAAAAGDLAGQLTGILEAKLGLTQALWRDSPAHAAELLGVDARMSAEQIGAYDNAMRGLLVSALTAARPGAADADELAAVLLAFTHGLQDDRSDPDAPVRWLRRGVALLIAGLDQPEPSAAGRGRQS